MRYARIGFAHLVVLFLTALPAIAGTGRVPEETQGDLSGKFTNPLGAQATNIRFLLDRLLRVFVEIGVVVVVIAFVYVGFKFVTARGNEQQVEEAKKAFFWTVVGAAVLLGAKVISVAIQGTIGELQKTII